MKIICLQKQNLWCESKNAGQSFSTVLFVIFRDNSILIVWKSIVPTKATKNLEESRPDYTKNWRYEKKHIDILVSGLFMEWKN